jgi:hypothetical protein
MSGIMAPLGFAKLRPAWSEVNLPIARRHGKGTDRILHAASFSNAIVEPAIVRDHPLRRRRIVRCGDANEIEDKDNVFLRQANQRRMKCAREQRVKSYPPERANSIALQTSQNIAGDPFGVAAAQERQKPRLRIEPLAFRPEQIFELSKRQGVLAIGQVGDNGAALIRQS